MQSQLFERLSYRPPMVGPVSCGLTNKTGGLDVAQPKTTPEADSTNRRVLCQVRAACPLWITRGHMQCSWRCLLRANSGRCTLPYGNVVVRVASASAFDANQ